MKTEDRYLKFVRWSEQDGLDEEQTYHQLGELVREEVAQLTASGADLPAPTTRPMRELAGT